MTRDRADQLAEAVWTRLLARWAMIGFSVIGSLGIPVIGWYLTANLSAQTKVAESLVALDKNIAQLRADWRNDQTADAGRFALQDIRIAGQGESIRDHDRRLQSLESRSVRP